MPRMPPTGRLMPPGGVGAGNVFAEGQEHGEEPYCHEVDQTVPNQCQRLQYHRQADWGSQRAQALNDDFPELCPPSYNDFSLSDLDFSATLMDCLL
ncbi:hypothetical protein AAFF_G00255950 [Aldrovandia affinis]|uniref:Uncharacterized protein n=1 Tax=Aldrovandia affinis TaxID=143900 RepID=A0AAD7RC80_9TELE|nr:hypothetical protein AAFF_G00255950 [Aldrovandia affinis]